MLYDAVVLVNRTTRSVSLTEAGQRHFAFCRRMLNDLSEEEDTIVGLREKPEGMLSVVAPKWISNLHVGDAVADFSITYPKIKVRFEVGHHYRGTHDFVDAGFDVAFQTKSIRDSSVIVKRIDTLEYVLCASPDYLKRHGTPLRVKDLAQHRALVHVNEPIWHFNSGTGAHIKLHDIAFSSNAFLVLQKAALAGMGIALLPLRSISSQIADGRLQLVLPNRRIIPDRPLYITYAPGNQNVGRVRCFVDFVTAWFKRHSVANYRAPGETKLRRFQPKPVGARWQRPTSTATADASDMQRSPPQRYAGSTWAKPRMSG